ncbi:MAG: hypothetical protein SO434_01725 [Eubacteriales bacterium]|nr:hypothetical protein [Eubacteriales bacterium]
MKKSMLLSTIAMIVVVVVALSTATFAWFSSFESVTASASLTVSAGTAGLELRENTTRVVTDYNDATSETPSDGAWGDWTGTVSAEMQNVTLTAPVTDIAVPVYAASAQSNAVPTTESTLFYEATRAGTKVTVNQLATANATYMYREIQVRSTSSAAKNVIATVTVKVPESDSSEQSKLAVDNAKIVLVAVKGQATTADGAVIKGTQHNVGLDSTLNDASEWKAGLLKPTYEVTTNYGGRAAALNSSLTADTITTSGTTKTFTNTWNSITNASADYITVRIYMWLDGHGADNAVKGGKVDVSVVFTTENA